MRDTDYAHIKSFMCCECKDEKCKLRIYSDINFILNPPTKCPYGDNEAKWVNNLKRKR